jgi:hypothetical protein
MKTQALAFGALVVMAGAPAFASPTTISYGDFSNTAGLSVTGAATTSTGALVLTPEAQFQAGAALTSSALALGPTPSFSTSFQFQIATTSSTTANGFAFVLTSDPTNVGAANGQLGLTNATSLAVEFSDYGNKNLNPSIGNKLYNSNLVAAIQNGNTLVAGNNAASYGSPGGATSCVTPGSGTACMNNGTVWTANISYANGLLTVALQDGGAVYNVITNYAIALGANVYAGFSGSTGAQFDSVAISNWSMTYNNVPEPMTVGMFGVGIAALGFIRNRRRSV